MAITIAVPKETHAGEERVALIPAVVDKFKKLGVDIAIQHDAGSGVFASDANYKEKDVEVVKTAKDLFAKSDMLIKIQPPTDEEIDALKDGSILVSSLYPHSNPGILKKLCAKKITAFALEMIPRISRAQSMDILSSQSTVAGYKAVLIAADKTRFFLPMLTTAAGTIKPANVLIIGAGVAGLQAIATAKRLGARVSAYDIRDTSKGEIESLGAKFVDTGVIAVGEGGYARELTKEELKKQADVLAAHIAKSDVIVTTAGVPGKKAPVIVTKEMIEAMKPGSVIVDIMAEQGGNCELTKEGKEVKHKGVLIVGVKNLVSSLAVNASEMFAKNILNFISPMFKDGELVLDWEDEVLAGSVATRDGKVVHKAFAKL